jgi:putative FmdB family regulatory protein
MPHYEFECRTCHYRFEAVQSVDEHTRGPAPCPKCGSSQVDSVLSTFYARTTRKA